VERDIGGCPSIFLSTTDGTQLQVDLEESVTTTIFIESHGSIIATHHGKLVPTTRVDIVAPTLRGNPEEELTMLRRLAVRIATSANMKHTVLKLNNREIDAIFIVNCNGQKLVHSLATADDGSLSIDKLGDNIATMGTLEKLYSHSNKILVIPHHQQK
jgi:hypothetical protein